MTADQKRACASVTSRHWHRSDLTLEPRGWLSWLWLQQQHTQTPPVQRTWRVAAVITAVTSRGQHKEQPLGNKPSLPSFLLVFRSPEMTVRSLRAGSQPAAAVKTLPHRRKNMDRLKTLKKEQDSQVKQARTEPPASPAAARWQVSNTDDVLAEAESSSLWYTSACLYGCVSVSRNHVPQPDTDNLSGACLQARIPSAAQEFCTLNSVWKLTAIWHPQPSWAASRNQLHWHFHSDTLGSPQLCLWHLYA